MVGQLLTSDLSWLSTRLTDLSFCFSGPRDSSLSLLNSMRLRKLLIAVETTSL